MSNSRLGRQLSEATAAFQAADIEYALIAGLALAPHNVVRSTQDAANYQRGDERLNLLYAHRRPARRLLADAATLNTPFGALRTVSAEGLIG